MDKEDDRLDDDDEAVTELARKDDLEKYAQSFTNVFDLLSKTHANEQSLAEKCEKLEADLEMLRKKYSATMSQVEEDREIIAKLKQELERSRRLTDAAHVREQNAHEAIETLRQQVAHLKQEIEKKKEMGGEQSDESGSAAKSKESLMKERERLTNELSVLKERLANALTYQGELEKEVSAADTRVNELTQELEAHISEASKEQRIRDRMEQDLKELRAELESREAEISSLSLNLKQAQSQEERLQISLAEEKLKVENLTKQFESLNTQLQKTMLDFENQQTLFDKLTNENAQKSSEIKVKEDELMKLHNELIKASKLQDSYLKKAQQMDQLRGAAEEKRTKAMETLAQVQKHMEAAKKQAILDKRTIENLTRQMEILKNNLLRSSNTMAEQNKILQIGEQERRNLEVKLGRAENETAKQAKKITELENERDRHIAEEAELTRKMQEIMEDLQFKQRVMTDLKKQLGDADIKFSKQQDTIEALRSDKNSLSKNLQQYKDEISELKQKLEAMTREVEQLKEYVASAEAQLRKEQSALVKVEKERETLRAELQQTRETVSTCQQDVSALHQEMRHLQHTIREGEMERNRLQKDTDKILNERDILSTQLVQGNDERLLLHEKIKLLEGSLSRGNAEYDQRMEDIRLLRLEVQTLRQEKILLSRNVDNMSDLRQEVLHLQRDLTEEKLKCRALEEELQNPLNVHRWRRLEGTDPEKFELILKVRHLQRRVLKMSRSATYHEMQMKETERRYTELVQKTEKQPVQEMSDKLAEMKHTLQKRTQSVKCLETEMMMYKDEAKEYKHKVELMKEELNEFKKLYYELKRKEQKRKEQMAEDARAINIFPHLISNEVRIKPRFIGGGFNLDAHSASRAGQTS
ncbi:cilia- and flagella-associated protein 58-like [Schistocerca piceifrons]|uniref:cilia- and flagella-associated protein 58-like n=1 Tax=Schistocerca piceifrons TaxID=274613 RepID=UPI001F5E5E83|nr:cilia- and flagella-associated protein 58-like [Schistocerca piceifrons]